MKSLETDNVKLLADLFHMNIEEADLPAAIRAGKGAIGHVHFVDSNRQAAGLGHTDFAPIAAALVEIGYDGYALGGSLRTARFRRRGPAHHGCISAIFSVKTTK